jgi:prophage antirepressor-like protein
MAQAIATSPSVATKTFALGTVVHQIRIVGTHEEPWFVAEDVADIIDVQNISDALKAKIYREGREKRIGEIYTRLGKRECLQLSESGLYKFLMRSHKPNAEPFQDWIVEILKSIRLEGRYELPSASQQRLLQDADIARLAAEKARQEADEARLAAENEAADMKKQLEKKALECEKLKRDAGNKHHRGHCIYLLRNPADRSRNLTKIGRTQDLSMRETSYHTGMPDGVDILHCCHTSDSKLAEQLVHHALKEYRYDDNREWFQGDPELFAHIIDFVTSVVDNLPLIVENMVSSRVKDRVRKELIRAKCYQEGDDGSQSDASAGPGVVVNTTVNVTVEAPRQEVVKQYITGNLCPDRSAYMDWIMLSTDFRTWAGDNGYREASNWKAGTLMEELGKQGVVYRKRRYQSKELGKDIDLVGTRGWKFLDDGKPATKCEHPKSVISAYMRKG